MPVKPSVPLSIRLGEAVVASRRRTEALPFFAALAGGTLATARYVDQLRAVAIAETTLERAVATSTDPYVLRAREAATPRSELILADLAAFDRQGPLPDDPGPTREALSLADDILRCAALQPAGLLGALFVFQGLAPGNLGLRAGARAAAGAGPVGTLWYDGRGEENGLLFRQLQERLDGLDLDEDAESSVLASAVSAAASLERLHGALAPAARPERWFLATTFNVEAGVHAVPSDPAEVAAALRAGERCLGEFPYFLDRWGERGRRFTGSDVEWLASLSSLEPAIAVEQVRWLGGVLARRGMPTLLLERQLLLLDEELGGVGCRGRAFLGTAARSLAERRESVLPAAAAEPIATSFLGAARHGSTAERLEAARLLLAAVADEATGLPGTVAALTAWYCGERYPSSWIAAVDSLLREAASALQPRAEEG